MVGREQLGRTDVIPVVTAEFGLEVPDRLDAADVREPAGVVLRRGLRVVGEEQPELDDGFRDDETERFIHGAPRGTESDGPRP